MKKHTIHTTKGGDKFLRTHIVNSTPWARDAYRPPAQPLPSDKASASIIALIVSGCILGVLALVAHFGK
jgi:hypothetical protein